MNEEEKENFKYDVLETLYQNDVDLNLTGLYHILNINKDKEKKTIAMDTYKEYNHATLNYSKKKGAKDNPKIENITPKLKSLIDNNDIDFEEKYNIVKLTKGNAKIIEKLIKNDDDYFPFASILFQYYGKKRVIVNKNKALFAVIRQIDRDNNTNVWRYKQNRNNFNNMILYISNPENNFFDKLKKGEKTLPDDIVNACGTGLKSLASKVCKYLSKWMFNKDNYYINDKVVRHVLLFYLDYYKVDKTLNGKELNNSRQIDKLSYESFFDFLNRLNTKAKEKHNDVGLTKNELDHILWYCYKSFKV